MDKKLRELRQSLTKKVEEAKSLVEEGKVEEARNLTGEAEILKDQIENLEKLKELEKGITDDETNTEVIETEPKVEARSLLVKALRGRKLNSEERKILKEGEATGDDISGAYIVPEDVKTEINEYKRQYKSMKQYVDVQPTNTNAGSFVYEKSGTLSELADLTEGADIPEQLPEFEKKEYTIKDKGALLPITNQLLSDEAGGLLRYIGKWFSRKAVKTENSDIFRVLKTKTPVGVESIDDLKTVINTQLDPELLDGSIFVTNQDGFNYFDLLKDENGRPLLQPDATDKTKKYIKGLEVVVFSNANLPNIEEGVYPVLVGNFNESVKFMDKEQYELATSKEAGFTKNITYLRAIERYGVVLKDTSAYQYLKVDITIPEETPEG